MLIYDNFYDCRRVQSRDREWRKEEGKEVIRNGLSFLLFSFHLAEVVKSFEVITQDLLPAPLCVSGAEFCGEDGICKVI